MSAGKIHHYALRIFIIFLSFGVLGVYFCPYLLKSHIFEICVGRKLFRRIKRCSSVLSDEHKSEIFAVESAERYLVQPKHTVIGFFADNGLISALRQIVGVSVFVSFFGKSAIGHRHYLKAGSFIACMAVPADYHESEHIVGIFLKLFFAAYLRPVPVPISYGVGDGVFAFAVCHEKFSCYISFAGLICLKISCVKIYYFTHIYILRNICGGLMSIGYSDFTVADILCPTVFHESPRPFRVGDSNSFAIQVCNNNVFFYGYLPLAQNI